MGKKSLIFVLSFVYVIFLSTVVYSQAADGQYCSGDDACDSERCMVLHNSFFNGRSNPFGIGAICVSNENWFGTCDPNYQCSDDGRRCESPDGTTTQECINQPGRRSYCGVLGGSSTCLYKKDIGASCSNNYECQSNNCRDGSCAPKFTSGGGITNTNVGSAYLTAMFDTTSCDSGVDCSSNQACSLITNDEFIYPPLTLADDVEGLCVTRENWVGSCGSGSTCNGDLSGCLSEGVSITCSSSFTYCRSFSNHAVCAFKKVGGLSCSQNNECISGECVNNLCAGEGISTASPVQSLGLSSFSTVASADCSSERTIFKISSLNNAHASSWDENTYQYSVCYNGNTVPANPHQCISPGDSLDIIESVAGPGVSEGLADRFRDLSINNFLGLSSATNAHAEVRLTNNAVADNYGNNVCYGNLFCGATRGSCGIGVCMSKLSSLTNAHVASCSNMAYPISMCCVDLGSLTSDIIDDTVPQSCTRNEDCDVEGGAICSMFSAPSPGVCIIPPDGGEIPPGGGPSDREIPGTGVACTTISQCEESEACFLDAGNGGYCDVCDSSSEADIDGDGFPDCSGEDPCVGSSDAGCFEDDMGLSCSDLDGIICGANEGCSNGEASEQATELNCCVAETGNPGCEGAPIYFAEAGVNVQLSKECLSGGRTQVEYIVTEQSTGRTIINPTEAAQKLELLGIDISRGNPYIDTTDYSCSNINLGDSTTGTDVPGYGFIGVLLSLFIVSMFYITNRKLLKS